MVVDAAVIFFFFPMKRKVQDEPKRKKEVISVSNTHDEDYDSDMDENPVGKKALLGKQVVKESKMDKPKNKQRVLILSSRGITFRYRHLMQDMLMLLPHSKKDQKLDNKHKLEDINEIAELNNCNNCLYFETRKHQDMYLWMSKTPNGPSARFLVKNIHTMDELNMTGNALKGSRPVLSFDGSFDGEPYLQLLKEMFTHVFQIH
jgi:ribosome biogenesis protein BRX1